MERNSHATAAPGGLYTEGDPAQGIPATVVTDDAMNAIQEELAQFIEAQGITLQAATYTQLQDAMALVVGGRRDLKNLAINGGMDVWQRETSFAVDDSEQYTADRFAARADDTTGSGAATVSRQAFGAGQTAVDGNPAYWLRFAQTVASTVNNPKLAHRIENVRTFSGVDITVSFWAKAATSTSLTLSVDQAFGSGGSADVSVGTQAFNLTTSWQRFTKTFTCASIVGKTLGSGHHLACELVLPNAATFTIDIADFQVELGGSATSFDRRPFGLELALCQRYYEKSYEYDDVPGTITERGQSAGVDQGDEADALVTRFRTEKRTTPSMAWFNPDTGTAGTIYWDGGAKTVSSSQDPNTSNTGRPKVSVTVSSLKTARAHWTAEAEL